MEIIALTVAFLLVNIGIVILLWAITPAFAKEMVTFAIKAKIASVFTWKVKKDDKSS